MRVRSAVVYAGLRCEKTDSEDDAAALRTAIYEFRSFELGRTNV
ncbi:hypothetical protein ABLG96_11970 [Nakamurella sp. A5-74]|uniref:Transposase n=1 Tax=Nakamurella sp. A5-74 TaxID=3158264 RepID=A0AAU8DIS1_9ACTN